MDEKTLMNIREASLNKKANNASFPHQVSDSSDMTASSTARSSVDGKNSPDYEPTTVALKDGSSGKSPTKEDTHPPGIVRFKPKPASEKDLKQLEGLTLVSKFLKAVKDAHGPDVDMLVDEEVKKRRRERKRAVNRESAKRKRLRQRSEIAELSNERRELEKNLQAIKAENSVLTTHVGRLKDEQKQLISQIRSAGLQAQRTSMVSAPAPSVSVAPCMWSNAGQPAAAVSAANVFGVQPQSFAAPAPQGFQPHAQPPSSSIPHQLALLLQLQHQLQGMGK